MDYGDGYHETADQGCV